MLQLYHWGQKCSFDIADMGTWTLLVWKHWKKKEMVNELSKLNSRSRLCKDCLTGKQQSGSFPKQNTWRALQVLQLIHDDIYGPIKLISNSKKKYLLTFTHDYSRKTWVLFLTEKSEAFDVFKRFKIHVEKEKNESIKSLRTDRGGVHISRIQ